MSSLSDPSLDFIYPRRANPEYLRSGLSSDNLRNNLSSDCSLACFGAVRFWAVVLVGAEVEGLLFFTAFA